MSRLDARDLRDIDLRLYLARYAGADPRPLLDDVEALREEVDLLRDEAEQMVQVTDLRDAERERDEERDERAALEAAVPRLFALAAEHPLFFAALVSPKERERTAAVTLALAVLPLAELLAEAHRQADRHRLWASQERQRLARRYDSLTKAQLADRLRKHARPPSADVLVMATKPQLVELLVARDTTR